MTRKKTSLRYSVAVCALFFLSSAAIAQTSQTVNEGATIAQPLRLNKFTDLQFGGILAGTSSGNVTIAENNSGTGFTETFPTGSGAPMAYTGHNSSIPSPTIASFWVTGEPGMQYDITLTPGQAYLTGPSGSTHMPIALNGPRPGNVNGYAPSGHLQTNSDGSTTSDAQLSGSSCSGGQGTDAWVIGGTLTVGANQMSGQYQGTFSVSVCYE